MRRGSSSGSVNANWSLYGPNNEQVGNLSPGLNTDFTVTLPTDGEYYLLLDGNNSIGNISYSFQVNNISDATVIPVGFGVVQTGMITAGETDTYNFTGTAGQLIFFDSQDPDVDPINVEFRYSDNTLIFSNSASSDNGVFDAFVLPRSGSYTLSVRGSNASSTGDYAFQVVDLATNSTALTLGNTVTETLNPASEMRVYRFTGTVGQRLYYDALESDFDTVSATILGPNGELILGIGNSSSNSTPFTLSQAGTYYLIQRGTSTSAADFSFRLSELPGSNVAFDTVISSTLTPSEGELYRFNGTAGQKLYFDSQTTGSISANWTLYGPDNASVAGGGNIIGDFEAILDSNGTYVLVVDGTNTANSNYSFSIVTPGGTSSALTLNTPVNDTINELGEEDTYTFSGTVGQRLYYDALKNDLTDTIRVSLISPSGNNVLIFDSDADNDRNLFTLTEAGNYQLIIDSNTANGGSGDTGSYNFQLLDVATGGTALTFDTNLNGTLSPGRETDLYRFNGTAGQRLFFDSQTTGSISANWTLYGPDNASVAGFGNIVSDFEATLDRDGTYVLVLDGSSATNISYSFRVVTPDAASSNLTLNTPVSGTIDELGEEDTYTFSGTVGQRLYYDALKNDLTDTIRVRLISPSGNNVLIFDSDADNDRNLFTLTEAGNYQLIIDSNTANGGSGDTGSYNFQLLDVATGGTALTFDTVLNGTLSPGRETDLYRFTGIAGQRLFFDSQTTGSVSANWTLYGPDNAFVTGFGNIVSDFEATLDRDGTYVLLVDGSSTTNVSYSFRVVTPDTPVTGTPILTTTDANGSANTAIPLNISVDFADSDANETRTITISGVPVGATLSAGTNNGGGVYTLTPAQLAGLTITTASDAILTVTATAAESGGDTAITSSLLGVDVNAGIPTITLAVSPSSVLEDGVANLVYTFTRTGDTSNSLTVNYNIGGTANNGTDYGNIGNSVTFNAGSATATVTVNPTTDTDVEPDKTVALTLNANPNYTVGTAGAITGTITNDDTTPLPTITLAVSPNSVLEDGVANLVYTFTRTGDTSNSLTVNYNIGGTANNGTDYGNIGNSVTFNAGSATATVTVNPTTDTDVEPDKTVALTLNANPNYTVGTAGAVTGTITNDDTTGLPVITLTRSPKRLAEDGSRNLVYTFTRIGDKSSALTVNYSIGGTATFSNDYTQRGASSFNGTTGTITFDANSATKKLRINPKADSIVEPNKTVNLTLTSNSNYTIGTTRTVRGIIKNDDRTLNLVGTNSHDAIVGTGSLGDDLLTGENDGDLFVFDSHDEGIEQTIDFIPSGSLSSDQDGINSIVPVQFATLGTNFNITVEDNFVS